MPEERIGGVEVRPGLRNGLLVRAAVKILQFAAQRAGGAGCQVRRRRGRGGFRAGTIANAVEARLGATPASDEIHSAVGTEIETGDIERPASQENFGAASVTGAARGEVDGV